MTFVGTLLDLQVKISNTPNGNSIAKTTGLNVTLYPFFFATDNDRAETFIHETFHGGPYNFRDSDMERALGIENPGTEAGNVAWDKELAKHCGPQNKK